MNDPSDEQPIITEEGFELRFRPRETTLITLRIPVTALAALEKVATQRDMSVDALMKLYIGHGLRQDLAKEEKSP